jgi:ankyrin repeat protein
MTTIIDTGDPRAIAAVAAIHDGDTEQLRQLLAEHPELASAALGTGPGPGGMTRSLLHVATDWPGHYPNVATTIALLIEAGADVQARFTGPHSETPLHWAASSDDVAALDALLDAGADIEATGAVIAGGTALDDAVAFGQWNAARRLVEHGAFSSLFNAAALGLLDRVREHVTDYPPEGQITSALWAACHGGQQTTAAYLLQQGADLNWVAPWDGLTPLDAAHRHGFDDLAAWLADQGATSAKDQTSTPDADR